MIKLGTKENKINKKRKRKGGNIMCVLFLYEKGKRAEKSDYVSRLPVMPSKGKS